jgi:hypothetical protein
MKLTILAVFVIAATAFALQTGSGQTPAEPIKVRGCLAGTGADTSPWLLRGVVLPSPPAPAPAAAPGGRGAAAPAPGGQAAAGARGGGAGGRGGDAGGRGGDAGARGGAAGGRGAAPATPPAPPPPPPIDLRLTGVDMTPWRNMFVELEGTLGPAPATGLREFRVAAARSAYGDCR